ncbi:Endonuclease/exonuclease/phosphatase [Limtongia smithiae]|uniref:Endonuclease/exonuclease/phosphatase n=1 Tax=Limtongia smithiae TaxID=1125753 RepID=UPI0034D0040B
MIEDDSDDNLGPSSEEAVRQAQYPDSSRANRRPPILRELPHEIACKYDVKVFSISGDTIVTSSSVTKIWSISSGTYLGQVLHPEHRVTAIGFKPSRKVEDEGTLVWLGTREGVLLEADLNSQRIINRRPSVHIAAVKDIFRCGFEMWTMDEEGRFQIWGTEAGDGLPSLNGTPRTQRVPRAPQGGIVVGKQLWLGQGKQISVFLPVSSNEQAQFALSRPIALPKPAGDITCSATIPADNEHVFFGHDDGKVSVYDRKTMACLDVVTISLYRLVAMAGVGKYLWVAFRTGMVYVYNVSQSPWLVMKTWKAHDGPIAGMMVDRTSIFKTGTLPTITITASDSVLTIWDGMLKHDWLELNMQEHDARYCAFRTVRALICTWNAGAAKPSDLQNRSSDVKFLQRLLKDAENPDIIVFGFQELVELDNKTAAAKSFFKKKGKNSQATTPQHMSHQYQAWQDRLSEAVAALPKGYYLLSSENLVGLYSCIFVRESERSNVRNFASSQVKTGLGGLHGNKGAIIMRFTLDDSSLCFVNCHLAAGQSSIFPRNNDIATILESRVPSPRLGSTESAADTFVGGGDGTMVLDHEICFVNGDMNYRINLNRPAAIKMIEKGELGKLLEYDQLLMQQQRNPGFRLRPFSESPITFNPTYKFDVGTDVYDTSEKRRTPAWCDRIYYRGPGKVFPIEYRSHDVRISDHRPVSGLYDIKIKTVDQTLRQEAVADAVEAWEKFLRGSIKRARAHFVENEQSS